MVRLVMVSLVKVRLWGLNKVEQDVLAEKGFWLEGWL